MDSQALATSFIERFCAGDVDGLEPLLAEDLRFTGPFLNFDTREGYLASLRQDPPLPSEHRLRAVLAHDGTVAVFWDHGRGLDFVPMAHLFRVAGRRISEILLIFDTAAIMGAVLPEVGEAEAT